MIFDLFSKLHGFAPPHLSMEPAFLGLLGTYSTLRVINFENNINLISGTPDDLMSLISFWIVKYTQFLAVQDSSIGDLDFRALQSLQSLRPLQSLQSLQYLVDTSRH